MRGWYTGLGGDVGCVLGMQRCGRGSFKGVNVGLANVGEIKDILVFILYEMFTFFFKCFQ